MIVDLATMPHLLVCGSSGSGKSVLLHSIISSIMKSNLGIRLVLIDGKEVEFQVYKDIKQLLYPIAWTAEDALEILREMIDEMDNRYNLLTKAKVNNIKEYNKQGNLLPYIVTIIDEFSDIQRSYKKEFQTTVCSLAQRGRASGIHLIISTQRPSCDVINGVVKTNFTSRIALRTATSVDSRVVLDRNGAERLLGSGDSLLCAGNYDMIRFQSAYIGIPDIEKICRENLRKEKKWWEELFKW